MFAAASEGSLDILKEIYDKEWDLTQFDDQGRNPLHVACSHGRKDVVRFLLNHGLSPNQPTLEDESTPLILAATSNHHRIVEMLLEHGADLVAQDKAKNKQFCCQNVCLTERMDGSALRL